MKISKTAVIHSGAYVSDSAIIHDYVVIYPGVVIEDEVEIFDHSVVGKIPKSAGSTKRKVDTEYKKTVIGRGSVLSVGCVIYTGTLIGKNVLLGDMASLREECVVGDNCVLARNVSVNYNTRIGSYTKIMDNTHITGNMIIEDHVFISTLVATTNDNAMGKGGEYDEEREKGPHIKSGATIGAAANILPAVVIGNDAVVGAGSVVTKDVPDRKVVMGIPARIVREVENLDCLSCED